MNGDTNPSRIRKQTMSIRNGLLRSRILKTGVGSMKKVSYRGCVSQALSTNGGMSAANAVELMGPGGSRHQRSDTGNKQEMAPSSSDTYLKTLSTSELLSLGCIGLVTTTKFTLDMAIKMFPYVPIPLMKLMISSLYCGGSTMAEVRECGKNLQSRGISNMMLSLTIEDAEGVKNIDIDYIVQETIKSIHEVLKPNLISQLESTANVNSVAPGYIALKPSALIANPNEVLLNFNDPAWKKQRDELVSNCSQITEVIHDLNKELAKKYPDRIAPFFVSTIDAEKYDLQSQGVYDLQRVLFKKYNKLSSPVISCVGTWQLYLSDSKDVLANEYKLARENGYKLGLKLVRGAYIHSEANRNVVIHPTKEATDVNYDNIVKDVITDMLQKGSNSTYGHLVIASHNYESQIRATNLLENSGTLYCKSNVILGQLLGMADKVTYDLINNYKVKNIVKYVPWGPPVETKDYLLRRLQENGDAVRADNGWSLVKAVFSTLISRN